MAQSRADLLQGTLDMLVMRALADEPLNGYVLVHRLGSPLAADSPCRTDRSIPRATASRTRACSERIGGSHASRPQCSGSCKNRRSIAPCSSPLQEMSGADSSYTNLRSTSVTVLSLPCLLYTSDAADERSSVDLGG